MNGSINQPSDQWNNFKAFLDLYQFWFTLFVNANLYSLGIAGGMLSFLLGDVNNKNLHEAKFALLLPGGICLIMGFFFFTSIFKQITVRKYANQLRNISSIDNAYIPSIGLFMVALGAFSAFQFAVSATCFAIVFKTDLFNKFLS